MCYAPTTYDCALQEVKFAVILHQTHHIIISFQSPGADTTLGKHRRMHFRLVKPGQVLPQTIHTQTLSG